MLRVLEIVQRLACLGVRQLPRVRRSGDVVRRVQHHGHVRLHHIVPFTIQAKSDRAESSVAVAVHSEGLQGVEDAEI